MPEPRPSARLAKSIARAEMARGGGGAHDGEIAARVMVRLSQQLGKLVGPAGFDVLLARALVLARRAHPVLSGVTAGAGGTLAGLDDSTGDRVALAEGGMAIVAQFIELLTTLIGEDLAVRLVVGVWPQAVEEEKP